MARENGSCQVLCSARQGPGGCLDVLLFPWGEKTKVSWRECLPEAQPLRGQPTLSRDRCTPAPARKGASG